jgi:hypothetical protein
MYRPELDRQLIDHPEPLGLRPKQAVSDVAECAVPAAEAGSYPVGELTRKGAVGVVNACQLRD